MTVVRHVLAIVLSCTPALGRQTAVQTELAQLPAPPPLNGDRYYNWFDGRCVAISEEWLATMSVTTGITGTEVYLYRRTPAGFQFRQRLSAESVASDFGELSAESVASDFGETFAFQGNSLVVGAPRWPGNFLGQVHVFEWSGSKWGRTQVIQADGLWGGDAPNFGVSVDLSGDVLVVGAAGVDQPIHDAGEVRIFERVAGEWQVAARFRLWPIPDDDEHGVAEHNLLGISVAVSGNTVVAGASRNFGAAYVYQRDSTGWFQSALLENPSPQWMDGFGRSVDIEGDTILVGMPVLDVHHPRPGRAYVYERRTSGDWLLAKEIRPTDGHAGADSSDYFGYSVALDGPHRLVVGAGNGNYNGPNTGTVYLFERGPNGWLETEDVRFVASDSSGQSDWLGGSVDIHEGLVVAGATGAWHEGIHEGKAYLFSVELSETYCDSQASSILGITGSEDAADRSLTLTVRAAPANARGLLFLVPGRGSHPFGSETLCLGSPLSRLAFVVAGPDGVALHDLDFDAPWLEPKLVPGSTWFFQLAHERDAGTGVLDGLSNAVWLTLR